MREFGAERPLATVLSDPSEMTMTLRNGRGATRVFGRSAPGFGFPLLR